MKKKLLAVLLIACMLFGITGNGRSILSAQAAISYSNLIVDEAADTKIIVTPGEVTNVLLPVKSVEDVILEPKFEAILPPNTPFVQKNDLITPTQSAHIAPSAMSFLYPDVRALP